MKSTPCIIGALALGIPWLFAEAAAAHPLDERVVLESSGWRLVGDWRAPPSSREAGPAALLLHRAAGSRGEYLKLADALAERGIGSLRLDLRGHGESDNLGRFEEPYAENRGVIGGTYEDIDVALRWIAGRTDVASDRFAVVGASYSGEAIGEALRRGGKRATAYVVLSPGSFSDESIAEVDSSRVPWLFIRTSEEGVASLAFIDAVFEGLAEQSRSAEIRVIPGAGHATRIFDEHPFVIQEVAAWLAERLDAAEPEPAPSEREGEHERPYPPADHGARASSRPGTRTSVQ